MYIYTCVLDSLACYYAYDNFYLLDAIIISLSRSFLAAAVHISFQPASLPRPATHTTSGYVHTYATTSFSLAILVSASLVPCANATH